MKKPAEEAAQRKPVEVWAQESSTPAWLLAAMRARLHWAQGREVTDAEFTSAAQQTAGAPIGYGRNGEK
jgi:hypothetical protein